MHAPLRTQVSCGLTASELPLTAPPPQAASLSGEKVSMDEEGLHTDFLGLKFQIGGSPEKKKKME